MNPSWRKPAGALGMLAWIAVWVVVVVSFSRTVGTWPIWAQSVFYLVAGVIWIWPLKPVLLWMETGRWRVPRD